MSRDVPFENRRNLMAGQGWDRIRLRQLRKQRRCQWTGCTEKATEVDHVIARFEKRPGDTDDLQSLCHYHHGIKTAEEGHRAWAAKKAEMGSLFDFTEQHPGLNT